MILAGDWSIVLGNPGKLALAMIGIGFNIVFFLQYFHFARLMSRSRKDSGRKGSLLASDESSSQLRAIQAKLRDV